VALMAGQTIPLVSANNRAKAHHLIDAAPVGAVMTIAPARRSVDQNAKMWCMISDVSRAKPDGRMHTPDAWKALFMHACGHAVQFEVGLDGQPFPTGFRTSRLTKSQMSDMIEVIAEYGSRHGVEWSDTMGEA
jgi:hypothetical protein